MKKILSALIGVLLFAVITFGQTVTPVFASPSYQTASGYNLVFTTAMTDSTGTHYSPAYSALPYLHQDIYTNYVPFYVSATGTADSLKITVQGRMKLAEKTYTTWVVIDTPGTTSTSIGFNKVDGIAYFYVMNLNGARPDQIRFVVQGASNVNRSDVVVNCIAVLTKQFFGVKVQ